MKKLLFIVAAFVAFACSNDDAPDTVQTIRYEVGVAEECPGGTPVLYEVDETTYNSAKDLLDSGATCSNINFFDIDGESHIGYLMNVGRIITSN